MKICIEDEVYTKYLIKKCSQKFVIQDELYAKCVNVRPETRDTHLDLSPFHNQLDCVHMIEMLRPLMATVFVF